MGLYTYTYFCDHCGAVIEVTPTNSNHRDAVTGSHAPEAMRQLGMKAL